MNINSTSRLQFNKSVIAIGLASALGVGIARADDASVSMPQVHSDSAGAAIADTATTAKVKVKLMNEENLKKSEIGVTTTNGVVTLDGQASSSKAKALAETEAKSIHGVRSVDNELSTPSGTVMSDSWITTKVKSEILSKSLSKGFAVSVDTLHGMVTLKGALPNRDAIENVTVTAENVSGVKGVDTSGLRVADK
jgi:hyperosmotically inducible protein